MRLRAWQGVRTSVPDDQHLEYLLDEVEGALNRGEQSLANTHFGQAILVARAKDSRLSEFELTRRIKRIIDMHGARA